MLIKPIEGGKYISTIRIRTQMLYTFRVVPQLLGKSNPSGVCQWLNENLSSKLNKGVTHIVLVTLTN